MHQKFNDNGLSAKATNCYQFMGSEILTSTDRWKTFENVPSKYLVRIVVLHVISDSVCVSYLAVMLNKLGLIFKKYPRFTYQIFFWHTLCLIFFFFLFSVDFYIGGFLLFKWYYKLHFSILVLKANWFISLICYRQNLWLAFLEP